MPPVICKLDIDPSDTFPVPVKLTSPDALLTANPVNVPVPGTANAPVVLSNVNPELPFNANESLNCICVLLPPAIALSTPHDKLPNPSVFKLYPAVPPDICKFATAPKVTFPDVVKSTIPVALLTVSPVNDPTEVIFGCALVVTVPAVVAAPDNAPTNVVAVIALFAKFIDIPELVNSAIFPVVALAPIIYAVPVPGAVTLIKSATLA